MAVPTLASLIVKQTVEELYGLALEVAASVGVNTTTWQAGDPTRSLYHIEAETLASLEEMVAGYISSGFLDYATGDWLTVKADQDFGVTVPAATFATATVLLSNAGGGFYAIDANDLSLRSTLTGKTYHNTTGGVLASGPGTTLSISVQADEAGSESSAGVGAIDALVTTLLGVSCANTTAAVGVDTQDEATTRQQCRDKLDYLSPARGAYSFVARNSEITGTTAVTRVRVYDNSTTGNVTVYVGGPAGAIPAPDLALVTTAILEQVTPLCITPTVLSVANVVVPVTYQLWISKSVNKTTVEIAAGVQAALLAMLAVRPIGGDIIPPAVTGALYQSMVESTILAAFPQGFRVILTSPAGDTALTNGQVAALGMLTSTINLVPDPL